jgi:transposase
LRHADLSLVLYDVTTLYFETHKEDEELRARGFSKDNKPQQPQIVIGLLVNQTGYPLGYEVFPGRTFEGHTMLPILDAFVKQHRIKTPVVVADAAMLSRKNIKELEEAGYAYIVGARLANLSQEIIETIAQTCPQEEGACARFSTSDRGDLIVSFSSKRYRKHKRDMDHQWNRAEALIARGENGGRTKFVKKDGGIYTLNHNLKRKAELLLGYKGYHTSIPRESLADTDVITRYHDLWNVEASFRMTKSDLRARPVFVRIDDAIRSHILICFVALMLGKHIELATGYSVRATRDLIRSITDAHLVNTATQEQFTIRTTIPNETQEFVRKVLSY